MPSESKFGPKIRALRRRHALRQVELAEKLGISASLPQPHRARPADADGAAAPQARGSLPLDLKSFAPEDHGRLISDLHEVFGDTLFESQDVTTTDLRETASNEPVSRAIVKLYHAYRDALESIRAVASKVADAGDMTGIDPARLPSEEVSDVLQQNQNHFPALEEAAERLAEKAGLDRPDAYPGLAAPARRGGDLGRDGASSGGARRDALLRPRDPAAAPLGDAHGLRAELSARPPDRAPATDAGVRPHHREVAPDDSRLGHALPRRARQLLRRRRS